MSNRQSVIELPEDAIQALKRRVVPGVSFRRRLPDDTAGIFEIFSQPECRSSLVHEPFADVDHLDLWLQSQGDGHLEIVAEFDAKIVAYGALFHGRGARAGVGWVTLFVHDDHHRKGIGSLGLELLLTTADYIAGMHRVELMVACRNTNAIRLYRRFGFDIEGTHRAYARIGDDLISTYSMARVSSSI